MLTIQINRCERRLPSIITLKSYSCLILNACIRNTEKADDSSGGNFGQGVLWGMIKEASLAPSIRLNDGMQVSFSFFLVNQRGINNVTM